MQETGIDAEVPGETGGGGEMTNQERTAWAQAIMRRQNSGKISKWEASAEFDELLDGSSGDLHFYSDTTMLRDTWEGQEVMVFPHRDSPVPQDPRDYKPIPSNTGIICQGDRRGCVILKPGAAETNAHLECLKNWGNPGERKWNPETCAK